MVNLKLVETADGSKTVWNEQVGEHYHSRHGALQESKHVFLQSGLEYFLKNTQSKEVAILEVGFGTGLNFLITADYCLKNKINLIYTGIEAFPLDESLISQTGYNDYIEENTWTTFLEYYTKALDAPVNLNPTCRLSIACTDLLHFKTEQTFDVLYFDAFAAIHQPEMWTEKALEPCTKYLQPGGVFVTYAITGNLKRTMKNLGFSIQKIPGAPGKREMLRATKV